MAVTQIVTRLIKDLAITTAKIADSAISLAKMGSLTTKGDLLGHSGAAHTRLGVGTDGYVLTADAAETSGIKWAETAALTASNFVFGETPAGTVDGTNATFTLANTPTASTLRVVVNGVRMNVGGSNDYTLSTATITFLSGAIPQTGDVILCDYMK